MIVGGRAQRRLLSSTSAVARAPSPDVPRDGWPCQEGPTFNERIQTDLPRAGYQRGH
jgi:hypothetical protein